MSVFIIKCNNCGHTFYDIVVLCTGEKVEDVCPVCNSSNLSIKAMEKKPGKTWAEEEGCHHGNPNKFLHGKSLDNNDICSSCSENSCSSCDTSEEGLTLEEEIDKRIESNNKTQTLYLPQNLRSQLKTPWGKIIEQVPIIPKTEIIVSVGDVTTKKLVSRLCIPDLAFVDHKVQRKDISEKDYIPEKIFNNTLYLKNPDGQITRRLYQTVERFDWNNSSSHTLVQIDGEEDLATLVCILHAPIGVHIFYGQPNEGLVYIKVDKKIKYKAEDIYNQFSTDK